MNEQKIPFWDVLKTLILFTIAFAVVIFVAKTIESLFLEKEITQTPAPVATSTPVETVRPLVSCPADPLSYKVLRESNDHVVSLISERKNMSAENGKFVNTQVVVAKSETSESKVACGYLFVRAGTENNGALQSWENVWINPNEFGGHIDSSNHFGSGEGRNFSEYLFSLGQMQYWKNRTERAKGNLLKADWATLLNVSETIEFNIALNTNNPTGFIDDVSIVYRCWNPKTGEENNDCKLSIQKETDTIQPFLQ